MSKFCVKKPFFVLVAVIVVLIIGALGLLIVKSIALSQLKQNADRPFAGYGSTLFDCCYNRTRCVT